MDVHAVFRAGFFQPCIDRPAGGPDARLTGGMRRSRTRLIGSNTESDSLCDTSWEVEHSGEVRPLPPLDDWLAQWAARGVPDSARLAFRWAQFPAEQSYAPGEWNQGMLATGLPPGSRFDLIARWTIADQTYEGRLDDVRCTD